MKTSRIAFTPAERQVGRLMRAPDHPGQETGGGGAESLPSQNNAQGNSQPTNNDSSAENNSGQSFNAEAFWNSEGEGENNNSQSSGNDSPQEDNFGRDLAQRISNASFNPVFTQEIGDQLSEGNLDGANESMTAMGRQILQQSVVESARVMERFGQDLMERIEARIGERFGNERSEQALVEAFPSAKDPAMQPVIRGIFNQAKKHAKDDQAAIAMTREMLKHLGTSGRSDLGLDTPPGSSDDNFGGTASESLVADLLAMK